MFLRFRRVCLLMLVLVGSSTPTLAGAPREFKLDGATGVYKKRFPNSDVSGERYMSENVLTIVRSGPRAAFIWVDLRFYNGHMCSLVGIAHVEGDALVYREALEDMKSCTLRITSDGKAIHFSDQGSCNYMCGARGGFDGETFSVTSRRPIRDLAGLKASDDYRDAIVADREAAEGRSAKR